jgi:hypothetical protein
VARLPLAGDAEAASDLETEPDQLPKVGRVIDEHDAETSRTLRCLHYQGILSINGTITWEVGRVRLTPD